MLILPDWLAAWLNGSDSGLSSKFIAAFFAGSPVLRQITEVNVPHDPSDVGRCVRLLDLAAQNGQNWRERMGELASVKEWARLAPRWAEVEAAYHQDVLNQKEWEKQAYTGKKGQRLKRPRDLEFPPAKSYWLVQSLIGGHDPYKHCNPHPFAGDK